MVKKKTKKITGSMTFSEILDEKPEAAEILLEEGMHCIGCPMSQMETLKQGCDSHGVDVKEVIKKLNKD
jgi:hybrid cluster-associated redox disulfide protein